MDESVHRATVLGAGPTRRATSIVGRCLLAVAFWGAVAGHSIATDIGPLPTYVRFDTSLGSLNVELFDDGIRLRVDHGPSAVANFLNYLHAGEYNSTFFHRAVRSAGDEPSILQGGAYHNSKLGLMPNIPRIGAILPGHDIVNRPNTRGTLAVVNHRGDTDGIDSEFVFNVEDNSHFGSPENSLYTVIGSVVGDGLQVLDTITFLPVFRFASPSEFERVPLQNYTSGIPTAANAVVLNSVTILSPWQNPRNRMDVNNNGNVSAQDVLLILNELQANGMHELPYGWPTSYFDIDDNRRIEPADALELINYLNALAPEALDDVTNYHEAWIEDNAAIGSVVPEPSSLALALVAVAGAWGLVWRRRGFVKSVAQD